MKKQILVWMVALLAACSVPALGQNKKDGAGPYSYIEPLELATLLEGPDAGNILILNTGPVNDIKGAVNIGAVSESKNLKKLKKLLRREPKNREIVVYCGCCPLAGCPNIRPARDLLATMHFTNYKVLRLNEDLKTDWIEKGYPMAK